MVIIMLRSAISVRSFSTDNANGKADCRGLRFRYGMRGLDAEHVELCDIARSETSLKHTASSAN